MPNLLHGCCSREQSQGERPQWRIIAWHPSTPAQRVVRGGQPRGKQQQLPTADDEGQQACSCNSEQLGVRPGVVDAGYEVPSLPQHSPQCYIQLTLLLFFFFFCSQLLQKLMNLGTSPEVVLIAVTRRAPPAPKLMEIRCPDWLPSPKQTVSNTFNFKFFLLIF